MKTRPPNGRVLYVVILTALVAPACGGASSGPQRPAGGVVRGTVHYDGVLQGPLVVAVFASFPPRRAAMAMQRIDDPIFPQSYEIQGIPEGRYFLLAMVDTDPLDGERYHPSLDPGAAYGSHVAPTSLVVSSTAGAPEANMMLVDPGASAPWASPGYR